MYPLPDTGTARRRLFRREAVYSGGNSARMARTPLRNCSSVLRKPAPVPAADPDQIGSSRPGSQNEMVNDPDLLIVAATGPGSLKLPD